MFRRAQSRSLTLASDFKDALSDSRYGEGSTEAVGDSCRNGARRAVESRQDGVIGNKKNPSL
jgi:hypothetical protein